MKKIIVLIVLFHSFCGAEAKSNKTDSLPLFHPLVAQLSALNLSAYQGQPVDSLLTHLPSGADSLNLAPSIMKKRARYLYVSYPNDVTVIIAVDAFSHMNPALYAGTNATQNWSLTLFKQEPIAFAIIYNGSCLNGCQYERDHY